MDKDSTCVQQSDASYPILIIYWSSALSRDCLAVGRPSLPGSLAGGRVGRSEWGTEISSLAGHRIAWRVCYLTLSRLNAIEILLPPLLGGSHKPTNQPPTNNKPTPTRCGLTATSYGDCNQSFTCCWHSSSPISRHHQPGLLSSLSHLTSQLLTSWPSQYCFDPNHSHSIN